jgi:hypothetical protein
MSAPLAGKFQDHYAILGIDPKSDSETIQQAYSKLAQKYRPTNSETADPEKFEALNLAYEVLSDPQQRVLFDKVKGVGQDDGSPKFTGVGFFDALGREAVLRMVVLCVLYDRRLTKASAPSLSMRHLELIVEATAAELSSAVWYLKQRGLAAADDKSSLQITVVGMDFLEGNRPLPEDVMPLIKPTAIAFPHTRLPQVKPAEQVASQPPLAAQRDGESVLTSLNRVLAEK